MQTLSSVANYRMNGNKMRLRKMELSNSSRDNGTPIRSYLTRYQKLSQIRGTIRKIVGQALWNVINSMPITVKYIRSTILRNNGIIKSTYA